MKGVFLHVMADTFGSVGIIISTLLIKSYGWMGFDLISSIFIAVLMFASVVPLFQDSARILMLSFDEEKEGEICKALGKVSCKQSNLLHFSFFLNLLIIILLDSKVIDHRRAFFILGTLILAKRSSDNLGLDPPATEGDELGK